MLGNESSGKSRHGVALQGQAIASEKPNRGALRGMVAISIYLIVAIVISAVGVRLLFEPEMVAIGISMVGLGVFLAVGYAVLRAVNRRTRT
jgi:hypothetical protein